LDPVSTAAFFNLLSESLVTKPRIFQTDESVAAVADERLHARSR
jgi:hypothetical protein